MNLHIVIHESFEAPAAILNWTQSRNHNISFTRLYQGDKLPENTSSFDFLIIMGGPQSPSTTIEECPHFDGETEMKLISKAAEDGKLVLGVCLGAQLIGNALGAQFDHSPNREIGVFDLTLTDEAKDDPLFSTFPKSFKVGHWHGDMPGLTPDSKVLAISEGCPRQIVRYTPKVYGFQCHFEFTPEAIEGMIENSSEELERFKDLPYVEDAETLRKHDYSEMNNYLFKFLDYMEQLQR